MNTVNTRASFATLGRFLKVHKKLWIIMLICELGISALSIIAPLFQRYAIDNFIAGNTLSGLAPFIAAYCALIVASSAFQYIETRGGMNLEMFLLRDMRRAAFNHIQTLSVSFFNVTSVGTIHARVMSDTEKIGGIVVWDGNHGIRHLVYVIGAIAVMFVQNALLALCVLGIVPVIAVATVLFQKKLTKLNRREREINAKITAGFNEGITGAPTTKSLSVENKLDADFFADTAEMKRQSMKLVFYRSLFFSIITFVSSAALAAVLWYGGKITAEQVIGIGTLSVFMTYAQGLVAPVTWAVGAIADIIGVKVNLERLTALLNTESDVKDSPEVIEKYGDSFNHKRENWEKIQGDIEFKNVSFKYPDGEEYVLENFNLKVPKGTNVAIVGETGAGKSTLVNLVCRFYEPTSGAITIDGKDVRERSVGWLHANIGYVLQTPHLFSGTVRENLLYGKPDATDAELDAAVKKVNAEQIIARMGGYDSELGEGGNNLSAGEKQLLSFARAILAEPAIFVLDEATASIDTLTEKLVQDAVEKLMEGRTSFIIAHRLSTVKNADVILVVDGGKIIERGTHAELLAKRGHYYELYLKQFREEQCGALK